MLSILFNAILAFQNIILYIINKKKFRRETYSNIGAQTITATMENRKNSRIGRRNATVGENRVQTYKIGYSIIGLI